MTTENQSFHGDEPKEKNLTNRCQEELQAYHEYEKENNLADENIDYKKIDQFLFELTDSKSAPSPDQSITLESFNDQELAYLVHLNIDLGLKELSYVYPKSDIAKIFARLIKSGQDPEFYAFFDYDRVDSRKSQNLKTVSAISDAICLGNLTPEEIQFAVNNALSNLFKVINLDDSDAEFALISNLLRYPPIKSLVEPSIMNYWFMWSDKLRSSCRNIDFEDKSPENIRKISDLLFVAEKSYEYLMREGLEPNENYADFILNFIEKCRGVDDYFLSIKAEVSASNLTGYDIDFFQNFQKYNPDRDNLKNRAFAILKGDFNSPNTVTELNYVGKVAFSQIAPDTIGYYDLISKDLLKVKYKGEMLDYPELVKLNYGETISTEDFNDLIFIHNLVTRAKINHDFGIHLEYFDLRIQNQFLNFIKNGSKTLIAGVREFILDVESDVDKNNRVKSFLSLEEDPNMGSKIFSIETNSPEEAPAVFTKYAEILDATDNVRRYLQENYKGQTNSQTIELISQDLLRRGKDLLANFADNLRSSEEAKSALENYKTETLIFASVCRALKGQQFDLEYFRKYQVDVLKATEIEPEEQQIMLQILAENWQNQDSALAEYAYDSLQNSFTNPDSRFYVLRYAGQILGFKRFDSHGGNDLYAGSFNINSQLQRSGIGEAAMREYLAQEAQDHIIYADASVATPITTRYIGEFGFVGTGIKNIGYKGKEFSLLAMERNDKNKNQYRLTNLSFNEIAQEYHSGERDEATGVLVDYVSRAEVTDKMRQALSSGDLVLTAYRPVPENPDHYLLAFEPKA